MTNAKPYPWDSVWFDYAKLEARLLSHGRVNRPTQNIDNERMFSNKTWNKKPAHSWRTGDPSWDIYLDLLPGAKHPIHDEWIVENKVVEYSGDIKPGDLLVLTTNTPVDPPYGWTKQNYPNSKSFIYVRDCFPDTHAVEGTFSNAPPSKPLTLEDIQETAKKVMGKATKTKIGAPYLTLDGLDNPSWCKSYAQWVGREIHREMERFIRMSIGGDIMHDTTKDNKNYLEDVCDGDIRKDNYNIRDCPYIVHVKGLFCPYEYSVSFRCKDLPIVKGLVGKVYPHIRHDSDCRGIAERLRDIAKELGHSGAQKDIEYWHEAAKSAFDAINKNGARHLEIVKENDELKKKIHGQQAALTASHNEIQRLRDMLDKQSLTFSKAWDQATLGVGKPIPELERLRRKNATLEREASNLRVKLDTAEGKAKD